jgi:hemerythrin
MYEMKAEYYIGIKEIDDEHKKLFEIAEEAYQVKHDQFIPDKYDYVKKLLEELFEYAKMHFEHEEAYMERIGYKKMFTQKMEHAAFIKKLEEMDIEHIDENSDTLIDEILEFLTDWLVEHILENDKKIAE